MCVVYIKRTFFYKIIVDTSMRGGALRLYKPNGGNQGGRGLGGVLKQGAKTYVRNVVLPYAKRLAKRKGEQLLDAAERKVIRMMDQSGGRFRNKRRRRRRRARRRDIFQY